MHHWINSIKLNIIINGYSAQFDSFYTIWVIMTDFWQTKTSEPHVWKQTALQENVVQYSFKHFKP